jgi:hypothetical protein
MYDLWSLLCKPLILTILASRLRPAWGQCRAGVLIYVSCELNRKELYICSYAYSFRMKKFNLSSIVQMVED